jgi:hypothetical protein
VSPHSSSVNRDVWQLTFSLQQVGCGFKFVLNAALPLEATLQDQILPVLEIARV